MDIFAFKLLEIETDLCPQVKSGEEILRSLAEINFKDKRCDFYNMYIHLVLTENWVLSNSLIEDNPVIYEMFCLYLQNCSTLISATNLRSYASKVKETAFLFLTLIWLQSDFLYRNNFVLQVRHRASYLLHFSIYK